MPGLISRTRARWATATGQPATLPAAHQELFPEGGPRDSACPKLLQSRKEAPEVVGLSGVEKIDVTGKPRIAIRDDRFPAYDNLANAVLVQQDGGQSQIALGPRSLRLEHVRRVEILACLLGRGSRALLLALGIR